MTDLTPYPASLLAEHQDGQAMLPTLITTAGEKARYKFVEFFTARLASDNTRRTYARAAYRFLGWCEARGLELGAVHPVAVAGYTRQLER